MVRKHSGFSVLAAVVLAFGLSQSSALAASPIYSSSDIAATEVITFDDTDFGLITDANLFSAEGVTFSTLSGEAVFFDSGTNSRILDVSDGSLELDLAAGFTAVGVDYWAGAGQELFFNAYSDTAGTNLILSVVIPASGSSQTGFFGVDAEGVEIRHLTIHDDAFAFSLDNLTLGTTAGASATPVPPAALLGVLGLGMVGVLRRRFR